MTTLWAPPVTRQADGRFVLYGVDWDVYEQLCRALCDHPTRLTFDGKNLDDTTRIIEFADWVRNGFGSAE